MKRILFVFDDSLSRDSFRKIPWEEAGEIDLLPFCGDWTLIHDVRAFLETKTGLSIRVLEGAKRLHAEVSKLGDSIPRWSASILGRKIGEKTLQDHFQVAGENISSAHLGPLAEKNPLKTDHFLHLAQAHAILDVLDQSAYDLVVASLGSKPLRRFLSGTGREIRFLRSAGRTKMRERLSSGGVPGNLVLGALYVARTLFRSRRAKKALGKIRRAEPDKEDLLFVTYFPYFDPESAKRGVFKNKYALPLQERLAKEGIRIVWLALYIFVEGGSFRQALRQAKEFAESGEPLYLLEEFLSLGQAMKVFFRWLRQTVHYLRLRPRLGDISEGLTSPLGRPIVEDLLFASFCGPAPLNGLLYYAAFRRLSEKFKKAVSVLYYCEMHHWEAALNAAFKGNGSRRRLIGFQHTCVSPNHFFYFHDRSLARESRFPFPDLLLANGEIPASLLARSGHGDLRSVEAIRYLHVAPFLARNEAPPKTSPVLLVVGSIESKASRNLLSFVAQAFPRAEGIEIRLKSHPSCSFGDLAREAGIDLQERGYALTDEPMEDGLKQARWVLVTTSAVAIEALAFGCEVIVPFFGNSICMSPVLGFEDQYRSVFAPEELRGLTREAGSESPGSSKSWEKKREFVRRYWNLDPSLNRWMDVLKERNA